MDIESMHQLLQLASDKYFTKSRGLWVFRGHSNNEFELKPSIGRGGHKSRSTEKYEKSLFDSFRREVQAYLSPCPIDEWELLSVAQHHGLPTRLLDWSHNILVALYFAVQADMDKHGEVFALYAPKKAPESMLNNSPFTVTRSIKYYPNIGSPRIRAQEGLFVVCSTPETPLDHNLRDDWRIEKLTVPAAAKTRLRYELFRLGVHESSLFPDIDGLTARLKWQHTTLPLDTDS